MLIYKQYQSNAVLNHSSTEHCQFGWWH